MLITDFFGHVPVVELTTSPYHLSDENPDSYELDHDWTLEIDPILPHNASTPRPSSTSTSNTAMETILLELEQTWKCAEEWWKQTVNTIQRLLQRPHRSYALVSLVDRTMDVEDYDRDPPHLPKGFVIAGSIFLGCVGVIGLFSI